MHTLFISNFYPPFSLGGYELSCQEVACELALRGHQICVLTSQPSSSSEIIVEEDEINIKRALNLEVVGGLLQTLSRQITGRRKKDEQENLIQLHKVVRTFQPDVALIWGMWNVPRKVALQTEQLLPGRVAYYLCDYWLTLPNAYIQRWQEPASNRILRLPKRALGKVLLPRLEREPAPQLKLENPICVSNAVRRLLMQAGIPISHARVIYVGIRTEKFISTHHFSDNYGLFRLLYAGRLSPEKGVDTTIHALNLVLVQGEVPAKLDIVGKGNPTYERRLKRLVKEEKLESYVAFLGSVSHEEMPSLLRQYDALIFPSEWEEPFARTILEAMAAGLVVIGTTTGGTGEILDEGNTGLTFKAGDAVGLAEQITRLYKDPVLHKELAQRARQLVVEQYTLTRMVNQIEAVLNEILAREPIR